MKEVPLTRGKIALVDDDDFEYLNQWKWCAAYSPSVDLWYAKRGDYDKETGKQKTVLMHRAVLSVIDPQILVDHRDRDGLNNCRNNLREADKSRNQMNSKIRQNSLTGLRGVTKRKGRDIWRARIYLKGQGINLGEFTSPEEAARAYSEASVKHFGEFARTSGVS